MRQGSRERWLVCRALAALLMLAGCSTAPPTPIRLYAGPERPSDHVSMVRHTSAVHFLPETFRGKPVMYLSLAEFDGRAIPGRADLEVIPGPYQAKVRLWSEALWASRWERLVDIDFVAQSGKVYYIYAFGYRDKSTNRFQCHVFVEELLARTPDPTIAPTGRFTLGGKLVAQSLIEQCWPA